MDAGPGDSWSEFVAGLAPIGRRVADLALDGSDPLSRHETWRNLLMGLAQGVLESVQGDADHPEFLPHLNHVFNLAAPPPDFIYQMTFVRGGGVYRLSGFRGTCRFVDVDMFGGHHSSGGKAFAVGSFTLDDLTIGADGYFSVILSAERPSDLAGDWIRLDPGTMMLLVRLAACDWMTEVDARLAIERLDVPAQRPRFTADQLSGRLAGLAGWSERVVASWLEHVARRREQGMVNRLPRLQYAAGAAGQAMYEGLFDIPEGQALLIETALPRESRYWSVMIADDQLCTIDWLNRQTSLNDRQALIDADGRLRVVVSAEDPGVPNWLDTAGHRSGTIGLRWNRASDTPDPQVRLVDLASLRDHLPQETPSVAAAERDAALRRRREGAQLRRRW